MSDGYHTLLGFRTRVSSCQSHDELLTLLINFARYLQKAIILCRDENFEAVGLWQGRRGLLFLTLCRHSVCLIKILVLFDDAELICFLLLNQLLQLLCDKICFTFAISSFVGALVRPQLTRIAC